jgi:signal transduction histidine kinase
MKLPRELQECVPQTRRAFAWGVVLALGVLASTVAGGWLLTRSLVRQQVAHRDAEALHATTVMEQLDAAAADPALHESDAQVGFDAAILASRLRGVMGIRFFDAEGRFIDSFPGTIQPQPIGAEALQAVRQLKSHSHFKARAPLSDVFIFMPEFATGNVSRIPLLEVTVPLHRRESESLAGAAQFLVEGQSLAGEYRRLDRHLGGLALVAFVVAGALLVAMLWPAFRKAEKLNRELLHRNENLRRANEELALAARSTAVGAVSAHLMHGLKNPLASLSQFVATVKNGETQPAADDAQDALAAARRMQSLVESTMEVLAEAGGGPGYEMTTGELLETVARRVTAAANRCGVDLVLPDSLGQSDRLPSQTANLAGLILVNLLENAIQVTAPGKTVRLIVKHSGDWLEFEVQDQGPGFPEHLQPGLFLPCKSTRESGSGIGLAISKQVADHLGARLELLRSTSTGCTFSLRLPIRTPALPAGRA